MIGRAASRHPLTVSVAVIVALALLAVGCTPKRDTTGWIPYWETVGGGATVHANGDLFSELSPFWYRSTGVATIVSDEPASERAQVVALAKAQSIPLIPAVRDGTPAHIMAAILANPVQRAAHVAALVNLVMANGYAGLDLDYEKFGFADGSRTWATTRPSWVQFVSQLSAALHARARLLTVSVPPTYNGTRAPGSGYWVYDYAGMAPWIDRLRILAYDFSFSAPGPVAPLWWVDSILQYAVTLVPRSKVQIGVPAYGRNWVTAIGGTCPAGVTPSRYDIRTANAAAFVKEKKATPVRDARSAELTFTYTDTFTGTPPPTTTPPLTTASVAGVSATPAAARTQALAPTSVTCVVHRTVWYSDAATMLSRAKLAGKYEISGISQWALGYEDPAQWQPLRDYSASRPKPKGTDPIGRLEAVATGPKRVLLRGWALDPEADLPITVLASVGTTKVRILANVNRGDIAAAYNGAGPFHGYALSLVARPGRQRVCVETTGIGPGPTTPLGCVTVNVPS